MATVTKLTSSLSAVGPDSATSPPRQLAGRLVYRLRRSTPSSPVKRKDPNATHQGLTFYVGVEGVEPSWITPHDFESIYLPLTKMNSFTHIVPEGRIELPSLAAHDFESCMFTNFITPAQCEQSSFNSKVS